MTRSLIAIALTLGLCCATHAQQPAAAVEAQRDAYQQQRIEQGLQSGQLDTREAGRLEREQQRIDSQQAHALRSGGTLTPQEQARINREQNQASRDIHRDKHNAATGNPNSASSQRLQADAQRNANQQQRIANGIGSGQLTNREAAHLERGEARIDRSEANAASNGHVRAGEQTRIRSRENRQNDRIYDKKHDGKTRGD